MESISDGLLVGVVSFGTGCAETPGVYARVAFARDWIKKLTKV
jgi:secreted trypsin-like serine protease